jgi:hypothetical protein
MILSLLTTSLIAAATTTVFLGSQGSPLSTKIADYLQEHPTLKNQVKVVDMDQGEKQAQWQVMESLLARCGISSTMAGIPAVVTEDEGRIECHTSDYPVLARLRQLNGCTALSECVATKKSFVKGSWVSEWSRSLRISDVCAGGKTTEASTVLPVTKAGGKTEGLGLVFTAGKDGRATLEVYHGKLTWILASAETSLTATSLGLSQRLAGRTSDFLEVSCR